MVSPLEKPVLKVVVVAGVRLYREGVAEALQRDPRFTVSGCVADIAEALDRVRVERPEIALVDMTNLEVCAAVQALRAAAPGLRVVALAVPETADAVIACAEAGVSGFVTTDSSIAGLLATLAGVAREELPCSPRIAASLLQRIGVLAADRRSPSVDPQLTARERQILDLIDQELSNKEIAVRLGIEVATVKNHVHNLLEKLHVGRRGEAAAWARAQTLATPRPLVLNESWSGKDR